MRLEDEALNAFDDGLFCAESVLLTAAAQMGHDLPAGIATGLCSGMAHTGGRCGALTGGILALGLAFGRKDPSESVEPCYNAVGELVDRFTLRFGATACSELLGCDLGSAAGQERFEREQLFERCRRYVEGTTAIVGELVARAPTHSNHRSETHYVRP